MCKELVVVVVIFVFSVRYGEQPRPIIRRILDAGKLLGLLLLGGGDVAGGVGRDGRLVVARGGSPAPGAPAGRVRRSTCTRSSYQIPGRAAVLYRPRPDGGRSDVLGAIVGGIAAFALALAIDAAGVLTTFGTTIGSSRIGVRREGIVVLGAVEAVVVVVVVVVVGIAP